MLKIDNIKKTYDMGDLKVEALKGISLEFRKSEFVSILGPSGCGKTTLLNIIGGLDRYTSGDLIINNVSTKEYKDKDWDNYRNHSVGFVFQSYNLIPHQSVLENVELALTLSGVSKEERRKRATKVLEKVGLGDKLKSRPNQLSGGQMQRVAIARALVNDPEIILADEPTGALDSTTSVQIMELLKEISKDKLIVMVTHNPELAKKYSSRIVKLLDGNLISDSKPFESKPSSKEKKLLSVADDQTLTKAELKKKNKKKRMSFWMALSLSFKNLLTKKGRTILVSIAGSIGIIGIALILAISSGFSTYVNKMQEDSLSSYPITIQAKNIDFTSIVTSMFLDTSEDKNSSHDNDGVYVKDSISSMLNSVGSNLSANDLTKFYKYINDNYDQIKDAVNAIQYTYDIGLEFYNPEANILDSSVQPNSSALMKMIKKYALYYFEKNSNTKVTQNDDGTALIETTERTFPLYEDNILNDYKELAFIKTALENNGQNNGSILLDNEKVFNLVFTILGFNPGSNGGATSMMSTLGQAEIFYEMIDNPELLKSQYDLVGENSRFVENTNEALLVLDKNNEVDDYILYALGIVNDTKMDQILKGLVYGEDVDSGISYDQILGKEYKILAECDYFVQDPNDAQNVVDFRIYNQKYLDDETPNPQYNQQTYYTYYTQALQNATNTVKIVGIVKLNNKTDSGSLNVGVAYTNKLTKNMVNYYKDSLGVTSGKIEEIKLDTPETINIYVNTFESKATIQAFIDKYNAAAKNGDQISYSDFAGIIMSSVSTIIDSITYVLIAFVSVSLVVSSIMIGIITYISVIERTKEIGVLRSVGASKRDIKRVFTAESFIIGLASGLFGILVSLLLTIPINILLKHFTGIAGLASLPVGGAIILVLISVALTFIAGLIPAKYAAKKDPVTALRSE